jgi:hypothetical protein
VTARSTGWLVWLLWGLMLVLLAGALVLWLGEQRRPPTGAAGVAAGGARLCHGGRRHHDAAPWPCGPVAVVGLSALSLWVTELKPVASELQPWSWPPRRPDLRLVHTCRDRSRPARTGGSRCRADPARTSTTARRRLRSHLVDSH